MHFPLSLSDLVDQSCFTSTVTSLSAGDQVFLQLQDLHRRVNANEGKTFWGLLRLNWFNWPFDQANQDGTKYKEYIYFFATYTHRIVTNITVFENTSKSLIFKQCEYQWLSWDSWRLKSFSIMESGQLKVLLNSWSSYSKSGFSKSTEELFPLTTLDRSFKSKSFRSKFKSLFSTDWPTPGSRSLSRFLNFRAAWMDSEISSNFRKLLAYSALAVLTYDYLKCI